jgi:hypothetical protein
MPVTNLKKLKLTKPENNMLWEGPSGQGPNGGITQSMLASFLNCRERFRVKYVLGYKRFDDFSRILEYGNMWHVCEEALAGNKDWKKPLLIYAKKLKSQYKTSQPEIEKWYQVCLHQFPIYVDYWKKHKDVKDRTPLLQEAVFDVLYILPSGREVRT